jgi:hypothetical protein
MNPGTSGGQELLLRIGRWKRQFQIEVHFEKIIKLIR